MNRLVTLCVVSLTLLFSSNALSQQAPDFDRVVLGAIDTVPTRAQLDATFPDARERLEAAALDEARGTYARQRAITLLSLYPDARTRAFLEALLADGKPEARKIAVYTLGRGFGIAADARLVETITNVIAREQDAVVREWAVRSLRWVAHKDARRALRELAAGADPQLAKIAALALRRADAAAQTK